MQTKPRGNSGEGGHQKAFERDWCSALVNVAKTLKLSDLPKECKVIEHILMARNQKLAEKLVKKYSSAYYAQLVAPNYFLSHEEEGLEGEFLIGYTLDGNRPCGLSREDINRHTFLYGKSGSGKSTAINLLFTQFAEKGLSVIHFDRKTDLAYKARQGVLNLHWEDSLKFNFILPPDPLVSPAQYLNDFVKAFTTQMGFMQRGLSIFLRATDRLYEQFGIYEHWKDWDWSRPAPTMIDLLHLCREKSFREDVRGSGLDSLFSLQDKLESTIIALRPVISCQRGFDFIRLYKERIPVNIILEGLPVDYQNLLILFFILHFAHYFRVHGPRGVLNLVLAFDESKGLVGDSKRDPFIADLISMIREVGVGLLMADQVPSEIMQAVRSNTSNTIVFRQADGHDLRVLREACGMTYEQAQENYARQPGEAFARISRLRDLHIIKVPFTPVDKFISRDELNAVMASKLEELNRHVIPLAEKAQVQRQQSQKPADITAEERAFLEALGREFFRPYSEVGKELGFATSKSNRIASRLQERNFISRWDTSINGKRATVLIPSVIAFDKLGIPITAHDGRGGLLHKRIQAGIKEHAEKCGAKATIEECNGTSQGTDVGIEKDGKRIAFEIAVTSKPETEAENINKNLSAGFDLVVLVFLNPGTLQKTKELAAAKYDAATLDKVKFCSVSQALKEIEQL